MVLSQRRRGAGPVRSLLEDDQSGGSTAGAAATQEDWGAVKASLDGLSAEHRQVIVLRYFAGLATYEIAQSLNVTEDTVKSRLHYALGNL